MESKKWKFDTLNEYVKYICDLKEHLKETDDPIDMMILEEEMDKTHQEVVKRYGEGKYETIR